MAAIIMSPIQKKYDSSCWISALARLRAHVPTYLTRLINGRTTADCLICAMTPVAVWPAPNERSLGPERWAVSMGSRPRGYRFWLDWLWLLLNGTFAVWNPINLLFLSIFLSHSWVEVNGDTETESSPSFAIDIASSRWIISSYFCLN